MTPASDDDTDEPSEGWLTDEPSVDDRIRNILLGVVVLIAVMIAAFQVHDRWPDTWFGRFAGSVPEYIVLAVVAFLLLGRVFELIGVVRAAARLVRRFVTGTRNSTSNGPFVEPASARVRHGLTHALADSTAFRIVVTFVIIVALHVVIGELNR